MQFRAKHGQRARPQFEATMLQELRRRRELLCYNGTMISFKYNFQKFFIHVDLYFSWVRNMKSNVQGFSE